MYALADINNFYVSCERVFRPDLRGKPVVVLSNNDGCIIARSNEAKALGIEMAAPAFQFRELMEKHQVHIFSSNYALYGDMSRRVMRTLAGGVPAIEVYSVDEAFLDLHGIDDPAAIVRRLRYVVWRNIGLPVSIGVAPTKTLAKVANKLAKSSEQGVWVLDDDAAIEQALKQTRVHEVWGIGARYAEFLQRHHLETAHALTQRSDTWIRKHMSVVGLRMIRELKGEPCLALEASPPARKSIVTSRSFGRLQVSYEALREAVASYTGRCAEKLRREGLCARTVIVSLYIRQAGEATAKKDIAVRLDTPSNSSMGLIKHALRGLQAIYQNGCRYKKAGVVVCGMVPEDQVQTHMFDQAEPTLRQLRASRALDRINACYGTDTVKLLSEGIARSWKLKCEKLSPCYTTRWNELLTIDI